MTTNGTANHADDIKYLKDHLEKVADFPKPGIMFRDTFSLCRKPECFRRIIDLFSEHIAKLNVDAVVGLEARGFVLGGAIGYKLNLPFIPIRKKGKLPGKIVSYKYDLEYGSDIFEVQEASLKPGSRVVIVDDLIATGGSADAAIKLLNSIQVEVTEVIVLVELTYIDWKEKIKTTKLTSFIKYDSENDS